MCLKIVDQTGRFKDVCATDDESGSSCHVLSICTSIWDFCLCKMNFPVRR